MTQVVLVCGGRDHADPRKVYKILDGLFELYGGDLVIVTGACPTGADMYAEEWAKSREIPYRGYPAAWRLSVTKAGPLRNRRMFDETRPQWGVVFSGGRGTMNMKGIMEDAPPEVRPHMMYPDGEFWK